MAEALITPEGLEAIEGTSQGWTSEDILLLLALLESDADAGAAYWRLIAPRGWESLLQATRLDGVPRASAPSMWFSVPDQRYGIASRGVIPKSAIRGAVRIAASNAGQRLVNLSAQLRVGTLDIASWQAAMATEIRQASIAFSAVGAGGPDGLTARHFADLSGRLKFQFERLETYAKQIELEEPKITVEQFETRPPLYMKHAKTATDESERISHEEENFIEEINILGPAEHCKPDKKRPNVPDCPSLAAKGWQPIGTIPQIGSRLCLWNCLCHFEFRKKPESDRIRNN